MLRNRLSSSSSHLLSPGILSSQDGPVLGAVGSFSWSGGAFLYPPNRSPTFINMSQEHADMRDSYLGEARLWSEGRAGDGLPGKGRGPGVGSGSLCAEARSPQVTPQSWPFGRGYTAWSWGPPAISTPGRLSSSPRCPGNGGRRLKSQGPRLGVEEGLQGREGEEGGVGPSREGLVSGERRDLAQSGCRGRQDDSTLCPPDRLLLRGLPQFRGRGQRWQLRPGPHRGPPLL